jgi:two-component system response regulator AtoC
VIDAHDVERELAREAGEGTHQLQAPSGHAPAAASGQGLEAHRRRAERDALVDALRRSGNNRSLAARVLGISRKTLYTKLADHGIG